MTDAATSSTKAPSRIQQRNRILILDAALEVFSRHGYRGATLDQIAKQAGLSKPNILYYFGGKEDIHVTLLNQLMKAWLDPLKEMNPNGDPIKELLGYVHRKLDMALELPRESRLFANEILQGAPRMGPHLSADLKPLFDEQSRVISNWMDAGKIARCDPGHLLFSIWATTQHYADFAAQTEVLLPEDERRQDGASAYLDQLFTKLLTP
ncbi:MAG: TetR family transcriptional regulator C-terminal domain-containing protein [Planktotalea sp.]|uniref:TetR family transcriptional regulator C-terminal domain-containing protein n=1 Tax=Planktotalea sp. TaxID=2029877 RepID=UPI0002F605F9|nr:TetR family transcriptional regulator C-terminal domain-containing protein [Planktotalea sp.]MBT5821851.1 TetR family transcriptional regulator [Paracoccaceae bacterium]MDG1077091.1 TetR family transcriptional regulator C-terminal domain-containing protein [Planktotalea sp.]MDG1084934.1 TetR family transcriptional regulator C-terminal domain-containing protein [Planktotalea sp.]HCW85367.1 TetR family transcriptional regulator [Paracoccaceae bacterium]